MVLSDAKCEWQDFVCPLQCSLAQVAARALHNCCVTAWGNSSDPTGSPGGNLGAPAPLTLHPALGGNPWGSCSSDTAPSIRGETTITSTQPSTETSTQLSDVGALSLPCSSLEIQHFQMETDPSLILLFGAEFTLSVMSVPYLLKLNHISLLR